MMYHFRKNLNKNRGFTVIEVVTALVILAIIFTAVLTIFKDAMISVSDDRLKMQAFELARENMERILSQASVSETTEYGVSEKNDAITWELRVEPFADPTGSGTWVKAISAATYPDANDQPKTLELTCWLTKVSDEVASQMLKDRQMLDEANSVNSNYDESLLEGADSENGLNADQDSGSGSSPGLNDQAEIDAIIKQLK